MKHYTKTSICLFFIVATTLNHILPAGGPLGQVPDFVIFR